MILCGIEDIALNGVSLLCSDLCYLWSAFKLVCTSYLSNKMIPKKKWRDELNDRVL